MTTRLKVIEAPMLRFSLKHQVLTRVSCKENLSKFPAESVHINKQMMQALGLELLRPLGS